MRKLSLLIAGLLTASSFIVATPTPASAATTWRYAQWNMQGRADGHNGQTFLAQNAVNYVLGRYGQGQGPMGISLQEICRNYNIPSQYDHIKASLAPYGYYGYFSFTYAPDTNQTPDCPLYGIAQFAYGTGAHSEAGYSTMTLPAYGEPRVVACMYVPLGAGAHSVCGTHLVAGLNVPAASNQMVQAYWLSAGYEQNHPGYAHYLGGDFNLCYRHVRTHPNTPYWTMLEANGASYPWPPASSANPPNYAAECPNPNNGPEPLYTWPSSGLSRKIDYAFGSASKFNGSWRDRHNPGGSDHRLLEGVFYAP